MVHVKRKRIVPYTPKQMYDLVNDVPNYKHFVPYCSDSDIVRATETTMEAYLTFSLGLIKQSFTTFNQLTPEKRIDLSLKSGPFKSLKGFWAFDTVGENTEVYMDIQFEIILSAAGLVIKPILNATIEKLVDVFVTRAQDVYG